MQPTLDRARRLRGPAPSTLKLAPMDNPADAKEGGWRGVAHSVQPETSVRFWTGHMGSALRWLGHRDQLEIDGIYVAEIERAEGDEPATVRLSVDADVEPS